MTALRALFMVCFCLWISGCSSANRSYDTSASSPGTPPTYKVGKPYKVAGKVYRPEINPYYDRTGLASWYGSQFHGRKTANGDVFDMNSLTAAHTTLPMPSYVRVTNMENGRWLILKVNDRGPFVGDRLIDVSRRAAQLLGFEKKGVTKVRVQAVSGPSGKLPEQIIAQKKPSQQNSPVMPIVEARNVVQQPLDIVDNRPRNIINNGTEDQLTSGKNIYVQIGAFADQKNAERIADSIKNIKDAKVDMVDINGQNLYRVRIGPQATTELAEIILGRLLSLGHNTARIITDYK